MNSYNIKVDKNQQIEKLKKHHPILHFVLFPPPIFFTMALYHFCLVLPCRLTYLLYT